MKIILLRPQTHDGREYPVGMPLEAPDNMADKWVRRGIANKVPPPILKPFDGERIKFLNPFAFDKDYGRELNEEIGRYNSKDWIVLRDLDTMFLLDDDPLTIRNLTEQNPNAGIIAPRTNRIGLAEVFNSQRVDTMFDNPDITSHIRYARDRKYAWGTKTKTVNAPVAGFCMIFRVSTWELVGGFKKPLVEGGYFDMAFCNDVLDHGLEIMIAEGLYVFHRYRLGRSHYTDDMHLRKNT